MRCLSFSISWLGNVLRELHGKRRLQVVFTALTGYSWFLSMPCSVMSVGIPTFWASIHDTNLCLEESWCLHTLLQGTWVFLRLQMQNDVRHEYISYWVWGLFHFPSRAHTVVLLLWVLVPRVCCFSTATLSFAKSTVVRCTERVERFWLYSARIFSKHKPQSVLDSDELCAVLCCAVCTQGIVHRDIKVSCYLSGIPKPCCWFVTDICKRRIT